MNRERDTQRSKLYKAESVVHGRDLVGVADMQRYVDELVKRAWFKRRWPDVTDIQVRDGRGRRRAGASPANRYITMPKWARYEEVVLHEVAHIVTDVQYGMRPAFHGWQFASNLIELVRYSMGKPEADMMKGSFRSSGVRFAKPKKRVPLTDEQKVAATQRLAAARAARKDAQVPRIIHHVERSTQKGWGRPYRVPTGNEFILMACTKKEAAQLLGADYSTFVKDCRWIDTPEQYAPEAVSDALGSHVQAISAAIASMGSGVVMQLENRNGDGWRATPT